MKQLTKKEIHEFNNIGVSIQKNGEETIFLYKDLICLGVYSVEDGFEFGGIKDILLTRTTMYNSQILKDYIEDDELFEVYDDFTRLIALYYID